MWYRTLISLTPAVERTVEKRDHYTYQQNMAARQPNAFGFLQSDQDDDDRSDEREEETRPDIYSSMENWPMQGREQPAAISSNAHVGVAYVRWGKGSCPAGADLVYAGRAAGSLYNHAGGGANYQCVTLQPENFDQGVGKIDTTFLYGAEYEIFGDKVPKSLLGIHEHDVPCAVCYAPRSAKITIPGTYKCPAGWTTEYYGFLMSSHRTHHRTTYECVDHQPELALGGHANHNGALFYMVEPRCGSLPCPPYKDYVELSCAVCTR